MKKENFLRFMSLIEDKANEDVINLLRENGLGYSTGSHFNPNYSGPKIDESIITMKTILNNISDMFDDDSFRYIVRQFRNYSPSNNKEWSVILSFFESIGDGIPVTTLIYSLLDHISMLPEAKFKATPVASICFGGEYDYKNRGLMYELIFRKY
jgi:hypothetical protein